MKRRELLQTTAGIVAATAIAGCSTSEEDDRIEGGGGNNGSNSNSGSSNGGGGDEQTETESSPTTTPQPDIAILSHEMSYDSTMGAKVTGVFQNTTDHEIGYVQISAYFYNESGKRVGESMDNASNVKSGSKVDFETIPTDTGGKPAEYELEVESA